MIHGFKGRCPAIRRSRIMGAKKRGNNIVIGRFRQEGDVLKIREYGGGLRGDYRLCYSNITMPKEPTLTDILEVIQTFSTQVDQRFDAIDERFNGIDQRFDVLEGRMGSLEGRMEGLEGRMGSLEGQVSDMNGRIGSLEGQVSEMNGRIGNLEKNQEKLIIWSVHTDAKLNETNERLGHLEENFDRAYRRMDDFLHTIDRHEAEISALRNAHSRLEDRVLALEGKMT